MHYEITQSQNLQTSEILMLDVIDDFVSLKKSKHTQRSYKNDITSFFTNLEVTFLNDLALIPYPAIVDKIK